MSDSLSLAAKIAAAYVSNPRNVQGMGDFHETFPRMFRGVAGTLGDLPGGRPTTGTGEVAGPRKTTLTATAVGLEGRDFLTCRDCGMTMKMLKRHLGTVHDLTPDEYREKYDLPEGAPMVASNYSKLRSRLAIENRLGHRRIFPTSKK